VRLAIIVLVLGASAGNLDGATPCHRTKFETELVKHACAQGGQAAAKAAMKQFAKDHKVKSCNHCHKSLAPSYDLKTEALDEFRKLGGK
jgi:hypothetical protein